MIDRVTRDSLAARMRHLVSGTITNFEFERRALSSSPDPAIAEIEEAAWSTYDDFSEHRLAGRYALPKEGKQALARAILFLKCDQPYRWQQRTGLHWLRRFFLGSRDRDGDQAVWPFWSDADYQAALRSSPYLGGEKKEANHTAEPASPSRGGSS